MTLRTLKPRLGTLTASRTRTLEAKAGTTERMRGERWMKLRQKTLTEATFTCVDCGRVNASNEIDHEIPLEQGGTYHPSNLKVRCIDCHKVKTAREAGQRAAAGRVP